MFSSLRAANKRTYARLSCDISPSKVLTASFQCLQCITILLPNEYFVMKYDSVRKEPLKGPKISVKVDIFDIQARVHEQDMVRSIPDRTSKFLQLGDYVVFQYRRFRRCCNRL